MQMNKTGGIRVLQLVDDDYFGQPELRNKF